MSAVATERRLGEARTIQSQYDVTVIGGGPVGAVAALASARQGRQTLLLESAPTTIRPFAGEWLHPPGVRVLTDLGVDLSQLPHTRGRGFVVYPEDGTPPVRLDYPQGEMAIACEHHRLVDVLRQTAAACRGIDYAPFCKVQQFEHARNTAGARSRNFASFRDGLGRDCRVESQRIIGADGRRSATRKSLGLPDASAFLSLNGGVKLTEVDLPFEGHGHVFVGEPGPILMYRLDDDTVRMSIDVPVDQRSLCQNPEALLAILSRRLPTDIVARLKVALSADRIVWMPSRFRPRFSYGAGQVALVGDAVGFFHPLTAAGMTMGFLDAQCLAKNLTVDGYAAQRESASYVPELLSNALYQAFTGNDPATSELRQGIYRVWRTQPAERDRLMQILSGAETAAGSFARATASIGLEVVRHGHWRWREFSKLASLSHWAAWPMAGMLPGFLRSRIRDYGSPSSPFLSRRAAALPETDWV